MPNQELKNEFRKRIYRYVLPLIKFLVKLPKDAVTKEIISQLTDSGTSIGANYFEAEASSSKKEFSRGFTICLRSCNETKFWLAILKDSALVPNTLMIECNWLFQETKEIANIFASSLITMKNKRVL